MRYDTEIPEVHIASAGSKCDWVYFWVRGVGSEIRR